MKLNTKDFFKGIKDYVQENKNYFLNKSSLPANVEKPKLDFQVNTGLYVIKNSLLGLVPKNQKFDMDELINLIKLKKFNIGLYPVPPESWSDIGQWQEYKSNVKNFPFPSMK